MKTLIFGAKGNLGSELTRAFVAAGYEVVGLDRAEIDVTDAPVIRERIFSEKPDVLINATAWNDVDGAENPENHTKVFALNAEAPGTMAAAANEIGAVFVHYSTDYVFGGTKTEGYKESDQPDPISVYGESKAAGERAVLDAGGRVYLARTSKIFGPTGISAAAKPSFVSIMVRLAASKPELSIVDEEVGMPTYTRDVAEATVRLVAENGGYKPGIYHLVNEGSGVTWYGFAQEFFGILGTTTPRVPVASNLFPKPAKRPKFAALRNTKFPPLRPRISALKAFFEEFPS